MASGIPGEKPPQGQSAVARGKARSTDEETDPRSFVQPLLPQGRIGASTTPKEETEGWERVRQRVSQALASKIPPSVLSTHGLPPVTGNVSQTWSEEAVETASQPAVGSAAKLLLSIWDSVQGVEVNKLACLRLVERCAEIILSISRELEDTGSSGTIQELQYPIEKLVQSFTQIRDLLQKETRRPFLERYIKRADILQEINNCSADLNDALGMFSLSVQVRILKQVQEYEQRRQMQFLDSPAQLVVAMDPPIDPMESPTETVVEEEDILPKLRDMQSVQQTIDTAYDTARLRAVLREALAQSSDKDMLRVLQVAPEEMQDALKTLQRALEEVQEAPPAYSPRTQDKNNDEQLQASALDTPTSGPAADTLDREFMEGGIGALRRLNETATYQQSWTITRYEVDREELIGSGSMGQVYKGTWRARTVAIKVLDAAMPQRVYGLFESLFHVWKDLEQPNVVDIYGASTDEPRFFLCPYAPHRGLNTFLAGLAIESDLPRFMHEIALGMEYLHAEGVLHGELKTSKVLVDEKINCLISDFGQEEIRSEVLRLSGTSTPLPAGARWHAPEPTRGPRVLTAEMDVYSYAICCVEILSMGGLPWPDLSDGDVRGLVLAGRRPDVPSTRFDTPALRELLRICWHQHPSVRPPFSKIVQETSILSEAFSSAVHKRPLITALLPKKPIIPPNYKQPASTSLRSELPEEYNFRPPRRRLPTSRGTRFSRGSTTGLSDIAESTSSSLSLGSLDTGASLEIQFPAYDVAERRNERRYRMFLNHDFHPSLTLPLWNPLPVALGAVGYVERSSGKFVTLFNCFTPGNDLPTINGYGRVTTGNQRQNRRNAAQRGLDAITSLLTFKKAGDGRDVSLNVSRRYSFPLRSGRKMACLVTESTTYRYMEALDTPKKWFKANADAILQRYQSVYSILKEDLRLVIGTLDAPNYALFVNHGNPDGLVHFNVYASPKAGQAWGNFSIDTAAELAGPSYQEVVGGADGDSASKVSLAGRPQWDTVLLAVLRFRPDSEDPTSLGGFDGALPLPSKGLVTTDTVVNDSTAPITEVSLKTRVGGGSHVRPPRPHGFTVVDTVVKDATGPTPEVSQTRVRTGSDAQPPSSQESMFVIYTPSTSRMSLPASNEPTALRPEDVETLQQNFPDGGKMLSISKPDEAEDWIETHYNDPLLVSLRSDSLGGPVATMLSPETPAVAIFGAVLDPMVRDKAKKLSDMSGFPVMIRPGVENPIFQFTGSGSGAVEVGQSEALQEQTAPAVGAFRLRGGAGSDDGSVGDDLAESVFSQDDVEDEGETTEDCDSSTPGVFRLRGGAGSDDGSESDDSDEAKRFPPRWDSKIHNTTINLRLRLAEQRLYNVAVISRIKFKTQPQVPSDESLESLPFGLVRPEIISLVDLQIKMRDEDTLLDRSHSNLGFLVHRADSIQQCDFLDRGFDEPHVTQKRAQQKSSLVTGGGAFGLTGIQPAAQITGSYARGATDTVESTDDRVMPRCDVTPDLGQEWDGDPEKSYGSYDASWKPALNRKGTPYEMKVNFGLGMYLHRDETHGPELPQISSVFRNQIMIWVFDPKLQAKVRGILLLTSTYIPDIKISTSLSIRETVVADMNSDWTMNPPARSDGAPTSEAAASVSLAALDRSKTKNKFGLIKKIGGKLRGQSSEKPEPFELPLYQTVSRGWDPTNKEWKHVLWPTLNKEFQRVRDGSPETAWKLQWKRDDEEVKEKDQDVGTGKQSAIDPADSGSLLVTKSITDSGIGSTKTASVLTV